MPSLISGPNNSNRHAMEKDPKMEDIEYDGYWVPSPIMYFSIPSTEGGSQWVPPMFTSPLPELLVPLQHQRDFSRVCTRILLCRASIRLTVSTMFTKNPALSLAPALQTLPQGRTSPDLSTSTSIDTSLVHALIPTF